MPHALAPHPRAKLLTLEARVIATEAKVLALRNDLCDIIAEMCVILRLHLANSLDMYRDSAMAAKSLGRIDAFEKRLRAMTQELRALAPEASARVDTQNGDP